MGKFTNDEFASGSPDSDDDDFEIGTVYSPPFPDDDDDDESGGDDG